jgi:hypothetical protein
MIFTYISRDFDVFWINESQKAAMIILLDIIKYNSSYNCWSLIVLFRFNPFPNEKLEWSV